MAVVTPELPEIFEEAYERAGLMMRSGYDLKTVRRSMNLLLLEWQNRGLNLFTIDDGTLALTAGTAEYDMPTDTIDLIEHQLRTGTGENQLDRTLQRMSVSTYAQQGSKNTTGKPSQIFIRRLADKVTVTFWPVPDSQQTYTLFYYRLKGVDGLAKGIGSTPAVPPRFVPCLTAGLAFHVAMKKNQAIAPALREEYEYQYRLAAEEDQETASYFVAPYIGH